jgi:glycosyltransferase involved in cell wall biosynthesis
MALTEFTSKDSPFLNAKTDAISKEDITVVLPVLNEEAAIGRLLTELVALGYDRILVVDGYSNDSTLEVAHEFGVAWVHQHGKGKTGAIRTAVEHVNTPYMLLMDGDYTYDPRDIPKFLAHAKNYDLIIGARREARQNGALEPSHRFGNRLITGVFNFLLGTRISDVLSGMYLIKTERARQLDFYSTDFSVEVEIAAQIASSASVTEVPINYRGRIGNRKLSTWRDGPRILSATFKLARLHNPAFILSLVAGLTALPGAGILVSELYMYLTKGFYSQGLIFLGVGLILFGGQALFAGTISLLQKRSESRIMRQMKSIVNGARDAEREVARAGLLPPRD